MRALLEALSTTRSLDRLRGWTVHRAEVTVAARRPVDPEAVVLDREGAVHRWPLRWEWLADDRSAADLGADRLEGAIRALGGLAYAVTMPAWLADDGTLWVLGPRDRPPSHEEVVVIAAGDHAGREVLVGLVSRRPPRPGIDPWERAALREPEPLLPPLGRAVGGR